ncbi:MazG nucleotide pyrophosphohydrolase domain-containing protein [Geoalkalibacter sp.]|uniref:MazG nucleotide pyrophosphohydrolase domain-containing protein n=1 Tax=Geoalkalibacter sp. TaxID=3041440 RepID=UPI00272E0F05|nr:MazG nucleotide pyrophosphohydrolase domain-containing protein [Geoalkalibacter sp.]
MLEDRELYRKTLAKWGVDAQYDQAVEECAELIAVLKHFRRGKVDEQRVIEELADVWLMVGQLAYMFGEDQVKSAVQEKLAKLENLLNSP